MKSKRHMVNVQQTVWEDTYSTDEGPYVRQNKRPQPLMRLQICWICCFVCHIKGTFKRWQLHGLLFYVAELFEDVVGGNADFSIRQVATCFYAMFCYRFSLSLEKPGLILDLPDDSEGKWQYLNEVRGGKKATLQSLSYEKLFWFRNLIFVFILLRNNLSPVLQSFCIVKSPQ